MGARKLFPHTSNSQQLTDCESVIGLYTTKLSLRHKNVSMQTCVRLGISNDTLLRYNAIEHATECNLLLRHSNYFLGRLRSAKRPS